MACGRQGVAFLFLCFGCRVPVNTEGVEEERLGQLSQPTWAGSDSIYTTAAPSWSLAQRLPAPRRRLIQSSTHYIHHHIKHIHNLICHLCTGKNVWRVRVFSQVLFKGIHRRLHLTVACLFIFFTTKWYVSVLLRQRWTGYWFLQLLWWLSCCGLNLTCWEPFLTWHSFECFHVPSWVNPYALSVWKDFTPDWDVDEETDRWMDKRIDWWIDWRICGQINRLTDGWMIDL